MSQKVKKGLIRLELMLLAALAVTLLGAVILLYFGGYAPLDALFDAVSAITNSGFSTVAVGDLNAIAKITLTVLQVYGKVNLAGLFYSIGAMAHRRNGSNGHNKNNNGAVA